MDSFKGMFGGSPAAAGPSFDPGSYPSNIDYSTEAGTNVTQPGSTFIGLPQGGSYTMAPGAPQFGSSYSFDAPQGGGGFELGKMIPAAVGGIGGLVNMFRKDPTDQAIKKMEKATGPMQAAGNQALQAYTSGTLTPTQQAKVDTFKKQQYAKWQQYLASAGIPESSAMADISAKIETDAQVYADSLLQQDFNNAFQATGLTTTNLTNVARQQALQDAEQRKAWEDFMRELGAIGGDVGDIILS